MHRRYFDNAATSFPKPPAVVAAVTQYMTEIGASAGRGAYHEALESGRIIEAARHELRALLGAGSRDAVIFTHNGTDALNLAIKGFVRTGDHVVTTALDHNSVLRPLHTLGEFHGVRWQAVAPDPTDALIDPQAFAAALTDHTRLAIVSHGSNVTGALQPLAEIAAACRRRGVALLVDAAQTAGHVPLSFTELGLDFLATPGHKGLLGPLGTGVLVIRAGRESQMCTLREGGTGSASEDMRQPCTLPDRFEPGSHNAGGIAGLLAGLRWLQQRGVAALRAHEMELCERMQSGLARIRHLQWFGPRKIAARVGVYSVRVPGLEPSEVSAILETTFGVLTRSGLHCSPLAHEAIGTLNNGGTTRLSFGPFTTVDDIDVVTTALREIADGVVAPDAAIARA